MEVGHGLQQLLHEGTHQVTGERMRAVEKTGERLFVVLHDNVDGIFGFEGALKAAEVGMSAGCKHC